jgi:hypothetical protein
VPCAARDRAAVETALPAARRARDSSQDTLSHHFHNRPARPARGSHARSADAAADADAFCSRAGGRLLALQWLAASGVSALHPAPPRSRAASEADDVQSSAATRTVTLPDAAAAAPAGSAPPISHSPPRAQPPDTAPAAALCGLGGGAADGAPAAVLCAARALGVGSAPPPPPRRRAPATEAGRWALCMPFAS